MIDVTAAEALLDFGARLGAGSEARAREQLEGAVALHNILLTEKVAYLADEVGMGKTYVALGALALFRHFQPEFRVLVIAPRANIQRKWMKELRNFVAHNVRYPDLRVKDLDGSPARPLVECERLLDFVHEANVDADRDFFLRLTSFSLGLKGREEVDVDEARALRDKLQAILPGLNTRMLDLRSKSQFKDGVAKALCCGIPKFDLVIVDEGHNLKAGFRPGVAARNRVLGLMFGHPSERPDRNGCATYGSRAERVLFLSATPIEETYEHLWNQLHVFGKADDFDGLRAPDVAEEEKKRLARRILIRRVTAMRVAGSEWTKNLYRREWRAGGVDRHDDPIEVRDRRQRLVVALVQKKVGESLGRSEFNRSFQIGMLASFESFYQTSKVHRGEDQSVFDDPEQAADDLEREGIDVLSINHLARTYRRRFGQELPHPKMDAVVASLNDAWRTGSKALVFVRRVASVKELKRKLDDSYNAWLFAELRRRLPARVQPQLEATFGLYEERRREERDRNADVSQMAVAGRERGDEDQGGADTFFAWFFRGEGPEEFRKAAGGGRKQERFVGLPSGAQVQKRFTGQTSPLSTFFLEHYAAAILECRPAETADRLSKALGVSTEVLSVALSALGVRYLGDTKRHHRSRLFEAAQAAAVELLKERALDDGLRERARLLWDLLFSEAKITRGNRNAPDLVRMLALPTFFTELRLRTELRERLWPEPASGKVLDVLRERELRGQLLAGAARLGHAFIDLYVQVVERSGDVSSSDDDEASEPDEARINAYLDLLEAQMRTPLTERGWAAFDELAAIAQHFGLILDVNEPEARTQRLSLTTRSFGRMLSRQQPVGGMFGEVNQTLVGQFRLPGYPFVLVTTDLLQEGEDLHTFCSQVHHYGISWTPSSMEQRIGRIDRVRSQTDRRLAALTKAPTGEDLLQVYYPYLSDTVELLQVSKVLERMNRFLRLMHEGLQTGGKEDRTVDVGREIHAGVSIPEPIRTKLETAFPVPEWATHGPVRTPRVHPCDAEAALARFSALALPGALGLEITWEPRQAVHVLSGELKLGERQQYFRLHLFSLHGRVCVRCTSPVTLISGRDGLPDGGEGLVRENLRVTWRPFGGAGEWSIRVADDVMLVNAQSDTARVGWLVSRVAAAADRLEQHLRDGEDQAAADMSIHLEEQGDES